MGTWNTRGLRGSFLEEMVNMTNEKYRSQNHNAGNNHQRFYRMI